MTVVLASGPRSAVILLRALLRGLTIEYTKQQPWRVRLVETQTEGYKLCVVAVGADGSEHLLPFDLTLDGFINWALSKTDDEIVAIAANTALNELNQKRRPG